MNGQIADLAGYWVHLDADVVSPAPKNASCFPPSRQRLYDGT